MINERSETKLKEKAGDYVIELVKVWKNEKFAYYYIDIYTWFPLYHTPVETTRKFSNRVQAVKAFNKKVDEYKKGIPKVRENFVHF